MPRTLPSHAGQAGAFAVALTLVSCAAPPLPEPASPPFPGAPPLAAAPRAEAMHLPAQGRPAPAPVPQRVAKVFFDGGIEVASAPLVDAVVGGQPTILIVDTGATHHVVAGWLARELSTAAARPEGSAKDHGGVAIPVSRLDDVPLSISGYGRVEAPSLLVVEVPEDVRRRGIGGVLSPQALVRPGHAVLLDLAARTLTELPAADLAARDEARGASIAVSPCAGAGAGVLVATATIEGVETRLELDTGSSTSSLSAGSALGRHLRALGRGSNTQVTASGVHTVPTISGAHVTLGSFASELDLDLHPHAPPSGCGEGYAGMDLLGTCALLLGGETSRLWCAPRR